MKVYDDSVNWEFYINGPFDLFATSMLYGWFKQYVRMFDKNGKYDSLFVEESPNLIKRYYVKEQNESFRQKIKEFVSTKPDQAKKMLKHGLELNQEAETKLKKGVNSFPDFETALAFCNEMAIHGTVIPYAFVKAFAESGNKDEEFEQLCEELRAKSFYPDMLKNVLKPIAIKRLKVTEEDLGLLKIEEVIKNDLSELKARKMLRKSGNCYVYQIINEKESLHWLNDTQSIINEVEKTTLDKNVSEIRGQIGFKGKVTGVARIVTNLDGKGVQFNKGDILVTLNSNPHLMHLIKKSGAIVSDMGGIGCHAAIVSRELKIPCIMGAKDATKILNDGDLIEVDAEKGIIRVLRKANKNA